MADRVVFDTNILINLLNKRIEPHVFWEKFRKHKRLISVITAIELLSFSKFSADEEQEVKQFLKEFHCIPLSNAIKRETIRFRRILAHKLPDSIIAATAVIHKAKLISKDTRILKSRYPGLTLESFE